MGAANRGSYVTNGMHPAKTVHALFVADPGTGAVEMLKFPIWNDVGAITNGVSEPIADWVDRNGNLYVVNLDYAQNPNVTEYDADHNLIFTYTGAALPSAVTTDKLGNVYIADQYSGVGEYPQASNVPVAVCTISGISGGVAVDKHGDVFVSALTGSFPGIVYYPRGLTGCHGTKLPPVTGGRGIVVDPNDNLVVCDANTNTVDLIAPPYTKVNATLGSGWEFPNSVSLDRTGTQAYVADTGAHSVRVVYYPGGKTVTTLGPKNGLNAPYDAVDSKNFAP